MLLKLFGFQSKWILLIYLGLIQPVLAIGNYEITPETLLEKIQSNDAGLIIDLRNQNKYQTAHIPTAINIWFKDINKKMNALTPYKHKAIIIYCSDGTQSAIAMTTLRKHGFDNLFNVHGNMNAWLRKKFPIESVQK